MALSNHNTHLSGFASFDAWIDAFKNDELFPGDDMDELTRTCHVHGNVTFSGLLGSRRAGVGFLKSIVDDINTGKDETRKAIKAYEAELDILSEGMKLAPFSRESETIRRQIADPNLQSNIADLILKAK